LSSLTPQKITKFYSPLALSWLCMAIESPVCVSAMSHAPDRELNVAAFNVLMAVALWIESPVIDLLATSTTLVAGPKSISRLKRFALWVMLLSTAVHGSLAFTPLFDIVAVPLLRMNPDQAERVRSGLQIMLLWSACIGWRRTLQGFLIRSGLTRAIGEGTLVRLTSLSITAFSLAYLTSLPGIRIAACALIVSVFSEAAFIHFAVRRSKADEHAFGRDDHEPSGLEMARFHAPMTATTMIVLAANLLVAAAVNQLHDPVLSLASLQFCNSLLWLFRTTGYALPEVVITLGQDDESRRTLWKYCLGVGLGLSGLTLAFALVGLDRWFFRQVLGASPAAEERAHVMFLIAVLAPFIGPAQSYFRGTLTQRKKTVARLWAIGANVVTLIVGLRLAVVMQWDARYAATSILVTALAIELVTLAVFGRARPAQSAP
jgi:hypothetical protein